MKDLIVNVLVFSFVILFFLGIFKFSEWQNRGLKNFEGLTRQQIVEGVEYTEKHSYNLD